MSPPPQAILETSSAIVNDIMHEIRDLRVLVGSDLTI